MAAERGTGVHHAAAAGTGWAGLAQSDDDAEDGPQKLFRITEAVMKVLVALRIPGANVHEVIQAHRRYLVQLMQQWTRIKEDEADDDLGLALAVDAELFRLDSVVRWLDAVSLSIGARAR